MKNFMCNIVKFNVDNIQTKNIIETKLKLKNVKIYKKFNFI